jgi:hypothetical protein
MYSVNLDVREPNRSHGIGSESGGKNKAPRTSLVEAGPGRSRLQFLDDPQHLVGKPDGETSN